MRLFVAYGYYSSEYDICVDLPVVQEGKPDYVITHFSKFLAKARCPPVLAPSGVAVVEV